MADKTAHHTIATFAALVTEMIEHSADPSELVKRYGTSLVSLRDSLTKLLNDA
jgi:imidazoleglycerol phosphate dehydratase HisB